MTTIIESPSSSSSDESSVKSFFPPALPMQVSWNGRYIKWALLIGDRLISNVQAVYRQFSRIWHASIFSRKENVKIEPWMVQTRKLSLPGKKQFFPDFNEWIAIKDAPLSEMDHQACLQFLEGTLKSYPPYLEKLINVFRSQVSIKNNTPGQLDLPLVDYRAYFLVRQFLRVKCQCQTPLPDELIKEGEALADEAEFDPHFHFNSFFVDKKIECLQLLPNYDLAYPLINPMKYSSTIEPKWCSSECLISILSKMKLPHAPKVVEIQTLQPDYTRRIIKKTYLKDRLRIMSGYLRTGKYAPPKEDAYDVCGAEEGKYCSVKDFLQIKDPRRTTRIHIGETVDPKEGEQHVDMLLSELTEYPIATHHLRLGHCTHASIDAMIEIEKRGYYVEACLTSNKKTAIISKRSEYPLGLMLLLGLKVVIGTDGAPLYSTSLALEYSHAQKVIHRFLQKIQSQSSEYVEVPNGQFLQFKHIRHLVKDSCVEEDESLVQFHDLSKYLRDEVLARISCKTLIENVHQLLKDTA